MESRVNQISHLIAQICSLNNIKVSYVWLNLGYVFGLWEQGTTTLVQIASVIFILRSFADSWTVLACTCNSFTSFACTHIHGKTLLMVCIM